MFSVPKISWLALSFACLTTAVLLCAADLKLTLPPETVRLNPAPGAELATAQCLLCHSADYISTQPRLTRAAWKASVEKMRQKYGAPIPADKIEPLVDYLVKNYGQDTAPAKPVKSK
jgi:mono/diheme cytochrome c family protein